MCVNHWKEEHGEEGKTASGVSSKTEEPAQPASPAGTLSKEDEHMKRHVVNNTAADKALPLDADKNGQEDALLELSKEEYEQMRKHVLNNL